MARIDPRCLRTGVSTRPPVGIQVNPGKSKLIQPREGVIFKFSDLEIIKLGIGWYGHSACGWACWWARRSESRHLATYGLRAGARVGTWRESKRIQPDPS